MRTALPMLRVEQLESSAVSTLVQCMACSTVRLLLLQSNQHKKYAMHLGWVVAIQTAPPAVRDVRNYPKRVAAASILTVDVSFARDVMNCVCRTPTAASSIDRADPSPLII